MASKDKRVSLVLEQYGNYEVVVIVTKNIKKSRKKLNKEIGFTADIEQDVDGLHSYNSSQMRSFILINPDTSIGVISHEAFHCTLRVMRLIGGKLTRASEEPYAYLLSYIVDTIDAIMKK